MSITRRHALRSLAGVAVVLVMGCSGGPQTSVTQVWKAQVVAAPMKSVLVFGARMDETNRRSVEDALVTGLAKHQMAAKPSYVLFPNGPPDRDTAREAVKQGGFDGLLVATLRNVTEKTTILPGTYYGGFWNNYYGQAWGYYDPGYVLTDKVVSFETTLWDARSDERLLWSANLETRNPSEAGGDYVKSLTDGVVSSLVKNGLLPQSQ